MGPTVPIPLYRCLNRNGIYKCQWTRHVWMLMDKACIDVNGQGMYRCQ